MRHIPNGFIVQTRLEPNRSNPSLPFGIRDGGDTQFLSFHTSLLDAAQALSAIEFSGEINSLARARYVPYRPGWRDGTGITTELLYVDIWTGYTLTHEEWLKATHDPPTSTLAPPIK